MSKHKTLGQVFTPDWIVSEILNFVGYNSADILDKFIFEPACGDGAFLKEIANRYIAFAREQKQTTKQIKQGLETYIYGVELDPTEYQKCIQNLNKITENKLDIKIEWKIFNENTLYFYKNYNSFFDFVVGNPPYIRIHNLDVGTRNLLKNEFQFSEGTIDIYLSFFELGLVTLKNNGISGFITPNSYLHNSSYKKFRQHLKQEKIVKNLVDFKANKVFNGFSTYMAISVFQKNYSKKQFQYYELDNEKIAFVNNINFDDLSDKDWSFSNSENEEFLKKLETGKNAIVKDFFDVQYGFATLRDKIFIGATEEFDENLTLFNGVLIEKNILKQVIKGSRFKGIINEAEKIIFPYEQVNNRYTVISEEKLKENYPNCYAYFLSNRAELESRDLDKGALWYEYGRSQGVQTIHNEKIVLSTLINDSVEFYKVPKDVLMYSGLFIIKNNPFSEWKIIEETLKSEEFYKYIRLTGKDFSGDYKSITSKQIKEYKIKAKNPLTLF
ncbi:Eco57I restriction-modification methylase domain-containing protein [Ignavibacteria bacterium]|nr:Eco57I restriction-modification methylase domain-containing protein [Bacteroidota bacterium]MCZ2132688.1 Eco57I restriction-modification methylase domain-containing protein [Bacteroidota bacterium]